MARTLEILEAKEEIRDLVARYFNKLDKALYDDYAACYTEDGVYSNPVLGRKAGKAALRKAAEDYWTLIGTTKPRHLTANLHFTEVDLDNGRASSECEWVAIHATEPGKLELAMCGHFVDKFEKVNGKWLIKERNVSYD